MKSNTPTWRTPEATILKTHIPKLIFITYDLITFYIINSSVGLENNLKVSRKTTSLYSDNLISLLFPLQDDLVLKMIVMDEKCR